MKKSLLFTLVMALLCLFGNVKAQTTEAPGSFSHPSDAWIWTGEGSTDRWDDPDNWEHPSTATNNYPGHLNSAVNPTDKVYIPVVSTKYPTLDALINIQSIYLESGAMLKGQYLLKAQQWYADIKVPTNRWVLVASPLKGVLSGDFYTAAQGGTYTGALAPSVYNGQPGGSTDADVHNRRFPYIVYERLFSNATRLRYAAYDSIVSFSPTWANPTNAMAYQFQPGEALEILARGNYQAGVTGYEYFHFPSNNDEYYYFNSLGQITKNPDGTDFKEVGLQDKRVESGKPIYDGATKTIELQRNTSDLEGSHEGSTLWAIGNPAFASLDIKEFLIENVKRGKTARYLYKHVASTTGTAGDADGSDIIYYLGRNNQLVFQALSEDPTPTSDPIETKTPYINSNRGFKVANGTGKAATTNYPEEIIGTYQMNLQIHPMNWHLQVYAGSRNNGSWENAQEGGSTGTHNTLRSDEVNITIDKHPTDPNKVIIYNFIGMAAPFEATVSTVNNAIKIDAGQVLGKVGQLWERGRTRGYLKEREWWDLGGIFREWTDYPVETGENVDLVLMTTRNDNPITYSTDTITVTQKARSDYDQADFRVQTSVATNVSPQILTLRYTISNGTVTLEATSPFAAYPDVTDKEHYYNHYSVGKTTHSTNSGYTAGTFGLQNFYTTAWNCFDSYTGSKSYTTSSSTGANTDRISVFFTENMFTTTQKDASQQSPRRAAAQGSGMVSINVNYNNRKVNTFIVRDEEAANDFDEVEDAAILSDFDEAKFSLGTLAGKTRVAVNALNDTTRCQIVLTGVNGDVDLVFDNLAALGENVRLFDANDSTYTPLNGNHATTTVTFGVNDSPLRYSLVWDYTPIIAGNETLTAIDFTAFSPAKGEVKVMSNELLKGVRVYNAAGQLITSNNANANEVSFSNLLSGIYVIEAYTANGKATKKVDVK